MRWNFVLPQEVFGSLQYVQIGPVKKTQQRYLDLLLYGKVSVGLIKHL